MDTFDYQVKRGDTMSRLAQVHHVPVEELARLNEIEDIRILWVGQRLKIPKPVSAAKQAKPERVERTAPLGAIESDDQALKSVLHNKGREVGCFGRVRHDSGTSLHEVPGGAVLTRLLFNTRVFISRELAGDWYFVALDDGRFGFVDRKCVSSHPPEPGATLYKVKKNETALQIVKAHYKSNAISWGRDERYYVNVLVEANHTQGPSGIFRLNESADWSQTKTLENYLIWIPTLEFARELRSKVASGSISHEAWLFAKNAATTVEEFVLASASFAAGLIHGALESIWDLLTGIVDLIVLVWDILKSIITFELFSDLKAFWSFVKSLKVSELVDAGIEAFLARWNEPDILRRWHFRGWVMGYAIAEIVMAVMTGSAALVKWAGKAGRFSKFISKFPGVLKAAEKVAELSKRLPEEAFTRAKKAFSRSLEEALPDRAPHIPWSGHKYVDHVKPQDAKLYEEIRELAHDFQRMNKLTGISKLVLKRVHEHLFKTIHKIPVGPNKIREGFFSPDPDIADLWTTATKGKLSAEDAKTFKRLMTHEYVESKLMEKGKLPYRSADPQAWASGFNEPTPSHHGAHDLAPLVDPTRPPFAHWGKTLELSPPDFTIAEDLSNLDELVQLILKKKRGWK